MEYFVCHVMQEGINLLQLVLRNIYLEYFLAGDYAYLSVSGEIISCNAKVFLLLDINFKYMCTYFPLFLSLLRSGVLGVLFIGGNGSLGLFWF